MTFLHRSFIVPTPSRINNIIQCWCCLTPDLYSWQLEAIAHPIRLLENQQCIPENPVFVGFLLNAFTVVIVQSLSHVWLCDPMDCSTPGFPVPYYLPEFAQIHVHWVSDAIQRSHPLSSPFTPALSLSQHQSLFQWVGSSHQVVKVLEFQLWHQSFQGIFRVDFLRIDWFGLLAIKGILKSFLQHHNSKASILWCSVFFMV